MDRQENNDLTILNLPILTVEERKEMLQTFFNLQQLQTEVELQNYVDAENGRTNHF